MKNFFIQVSLLTLIVSIVGCVDNNEISQTTQPSFNSTERAYPGLVGNVKKAFFNGYPISFQQINGDAVFQGDIILRSDELSDEPVESTTTGRSRTSARWPNKIVYYQIDPSIPNQQRIFDAMAHWEANTPIRFVARTTQRGYVLFKLSGGCSANVGYTGGLQYVYVGNVCTAGSIIHEIGHAVGLWHEHSRADQDNHVTIHYGNVIPGTESNFFTYLGQNFDGFDLGGSMDFSSIMMYSPYDFTKNGQPTITKKDGSLFTVQRSGLSPLDIATVAAMYP